MFSFKVRCFIYLRWPQTSNVDPRRRVNTSETAMYSQKYSFTNLIVWTINMAVVKTHAKLKKRSQLKCIKTKQWQQLWNDTSSEMAHVSTFFMTTEKNYVTVSGQRRKMPNQGQIQDRVHSRTDLSNEELSLKIQDGTVTLNVFQRNLNWWVC